MEAPERCHGLAHRDGAFVCSGSSEHRASVPAQNMRSVQIERLASVPVNVEPPRPVVPGGAGWGVVTPTTGRVARVPAAYSVGQVKRGRGLG